MKLTGNPFKDTKSVVKSVSSTVRGGGGVKDLVTSPLSVLRDTLQGTASAAMSGGNPYVVARDVAATPFEVALEEAKAKAKRAWNESKQTNRQILREAEEAGRDAYGDMAERAPGDVGYRMRQAEDRGRIARQKLREDWFNNLWENLKTNVRSDPVLKPVRKGNRYVMEKWLGLDDQERAGLGGRSATIGGTIGGAYGQGWVGPAIALVHGIDEDVDASTAASNAIAGLAAGYGTQYATGGEGFGALGAKAAYPVAAGAVVGAAAPGGDFRASGSERGHGAVMGGLGGLTGGWGSVGAQGADVVAKRLDKEDEMAYLLAVADAYRGNYGGAVGRLANMQAARQEDPKKRLYWQAGALASGMAQNEYNRQAAAPSAGEVPRESREPAAREAAGGAEMVNPYGSIDWSQTEPQVSRQDEPLFPQQYSTDAGQGIDWSQTQPQASQQTQPLFQSPQSTYDWGNSDPYGEIPIHTRGAPKMAEATPWYGSFTQPSTMGRMAGMAAPIAKVGLSYLTNMQQQKAMAEERKARKKALSWIQQAQDNPESVYRNNPGLQQLRANRLNAVKASYAAKYGGTGGGRYMRDLMTQQAAFDQAALNDAINQRMQTVNATSYVPAAMAQYGGTSLGALTGAAGEGVGDAYYYNVLLPQMLEEQRRQRPTQP